MTRRLIVHHGKTYDDEKLVIVTLFEEGYSKEEIKKEIAYCKTYETLINRGNRYEFVRENA